MHLMERESLFSDCLIHLIRVKMEERKANSSCSKHKNVLDFKSLLNKKEMKLLTSSPTASGWNYFSTHCAVKSRQKNANKNHPILSMTIKVPE